VGVNFGLWGLSVLPTYLVARKVGLATDREEEDDGVEDNIGVSLSKGHGSN